MQVVCLIYCTCTWFNIRICLKILIHDIWNVYIASFLDTLFKEKCKYRYILRRVNSLIQTLQFILATEDRHRVSRMGSIASRASSFFESIGKNKGKKMAASLPTSNSLGNLVETGSENNSQIDLIPLETNMNYTSSFNKNSCHSIEDLVCDRKTLHQGM